ncbi:hypothetical protein Tco_0942509 [Tanacetum coccineum]
MQGMFINSFNATPIGVYSHTVSVQSSRLEDSKDDITTVCSISASWRCSYNNQTILTSRINQDSTEEEPEVNLENITNSYKVPTTPNTRIHKDHAIDNVIGDVKSSVQTRKMTKPTSEQGFLSNVWILMDLPSGKRAIGTKWVFRNKKDERGIVIMNKGRIAERGHSMGRPT